MLKPYSTGTISEWSRFVNFLLHNCLSGHKLDCFCERSEIRFLPICSNDVLRPVFRPVLRYLLQIG